ncbi:uncharacterized protein PgNI_04889 [Pyricularia grisea]|uniref:Uncharacterized protein n=1 Tax=Pyricularia grisea TaxID=148305 RepID=A0A6P8BCN4_PYRGI|nr:uncharacterized protein PgNI_04889 [Pyricularia grisea]TLD13524.1 hypothetical protein PgNI_04889 [Pyricularia grisea]
MKVVEVIQDLPRFVASGALKVLTISYSGPYAYHTVDPIERVAELNNATPRDDNQLIKALAHFRYLKNQELEFVGKAAALSAAAVVGVFSWPTAEKTIWVAKMLWNWSFFTSCFALISSAQQRLLRRLPGPEDDDLVFPDEQVQIALNLLLQPVVRPPGGGKEKGRRVSRRMLYIWQNPTMLMSYSWVMFIAGYALHILTPVFDPSQGEVSSTVAIATLCGCALVVLNFAFCAGVCQFRLRPGKTHGDSVDSWLPGGHARHPAA